MRRAGRIRLRSRLHPRKLRIKVYARNKKSNYKDEKLQVNWPAAAVSADEVKRTVILRVVGIDIFRCSRHHEAVPVKRVVFTELSSSGFEGFFPISRLLSIVLNPVKINCHKLTLNINECGQEAQNDFRLIEKNEWTIIEAHFFLRECISNRIFCDSSSRRFSSERRWPLSSNQDCLRPRISSWYFSEAFFTASYASLERLKWKNGHHSIVKCFHIKNQENIWKNTRNFILTFWLLGLRWDETFHRRANSLWTAETPTWMHHIPRLLSWPCNS